MTTPRRPTRREALLGTAALMLEGCDLGGGARRAATTGSTLTSTWGDPLGDGQLRVLPGESLLARTELSPASPHTMVLATLAHVTDAHVMDASSPARVPFLDRLGPPFQSAFRPQEALTARVFDGALQAIKALQADAVIQGGDLIDNAQANELACALTVLGSSPGRQAKPGSGPHGYYGVQSAADPDPFYYRPDLDAPRHPGLLRAAARPFRPAGLHHGAAVYPVLGDHDILVQGELVPDRLTQALAVGSKALWDLPQGLALPPGLHVTAGGSPDGPLLPGIVDQLLGEALQGPTVEVPADPRRRELGVDDVLGMLGVGRLGAAAARADYSAQIGPSLQLIVLDLARRAGGSGGLVVAGQAAFLEEQLAQAGDRWVIVVSHQPLESSEGGDELLAIMDAHPRVIAALAGHIHRNSIVARQTAQGGYWLITTASLIDYPQQARALQIVGMRNGGVAIKTWMLDHVGDAPIGTISRQLSYLDAQGGRPLSFRGAHGDRNATLYRPGLH